MATLLPRALQLISLRRGYINPGKNEARGQYWAWKLKCLKISEAETVNL